jgi:hypothetical protein
LQQQQRRLSVEMSSLPSSTPNSSHSSGTPASQQQDVAAAAAAAGQRLNSLSDGSAGAGGSPTAGRLRGVQQASSAAASGSDSEAEGASPGRLQKPRKASRLHKASS